MCWLLVLLLAGCQQFNFDMLRSQSPDDDVDDEFETKVETPFIGEYTRTAGLHLITLQGVGLVTGLDNTGGDPPPSAFRTTLLNDMRRRGVRNPNAILKSPKTALVVVTAYFPPLIQKGDPFDLEVRLPGNGDATSLNGGWLMETYLAEQAIVAGRGAMKGHVFAKAKGPILISTGEGDKESLAGVLRRGRVLGGGKSLRDRDMSLLLRNDFRSVRNSKRIADRIGLRFHLYSRNGSKEPLAKAKTDQKIVLKILPKYKDNFPRFLNVVRNIAFRETQVAQRVRMEQLKEKLHKPATAERAALQLEAIGLIAVPFLKTGLKSPSLEARFHSAVALAYLEDPAGVDVLAEAARKEPAFRVFALAALATIDEPESHLALRELMNERSAETRYGAFRALSTMNKNDAFIRGEMLNDQFRLHVLDTKGDSMIHLTHHRKAEIVLFGTDQRFHTPMVVRAGKNILVTATPNNDTITVSRYVIGREDKQKVVSTRVAEVIRTVAEFGASYPDVAQMLAQADKQHNTAGPIQIDALPQAGRIYFRNTDHSGNGFQSKARVGRSNSVPNLFDRGKITDNRRPRDESLTTDSDAETGTASAADVRSTAFEDSLDEPRKRFDLFRVFKRRAKANDLKEK